MITTENMEWRYATKRYDAEHALPSEIIEALQEALHLCPSSINSQPWRFHFVTNHFIKSELAEVSYFNAEKIKQAPLLIVFSYITNIGEFEQDILSTLAPGAQEYYHNFLKPLPDRDIVAWFRQQLYIAVGTALSTCASLRVDSTPMEGIDREQYNAILQQSDYSALVAMSVGYRDSEDYNQPSHTPKQRRDIAEVIDMM